MPWIWDGLVADKGGSKGKFTFQSYLLEEKMISSSLFLCGPRYPAANVNSVTLLTIHRFLGALRAAIEG